MWFQGQISLSANPKSPSQSAASSTKQSKPGSATMPGRERSNSRRTTDLCLKMRKCSLPLGLLFQLLRPFTPPSAPLLLDHGDALRPHSESDAVSHSAR